jgi:hypothetical protein
VRAVDASHPAKSDMICNQSVWPCFPLQPEVANKARKRHTALQGMLADAHTTLAQTSYDELVIMVRHPTTSPMFE